MAYPKDEDLRLSYWTNQLSYSLKKMRPIFKACQVLINQYNNDPTTEREKLNKEYSTEEEHISRTKSNLIFGWIEQSIANLLDRNPVFTVTPKTKSSADGASKVSGISNYYYRETNQLHQDERILQDAFLCPYGVKKLGWTADMELKAQELLRPEATLVFNTPEDEILYLLEGMPTKVIEDQDHVIFIEMYTRVLQNPIALAPPIEALIREQLRLRKKFLNRMEPSLNADVHFESPFGIRWSPDLFLHDTLAQDGINDARWVSFGWKLPIDDVIDNPNYEHTQDLRPSARMEEAPDPTISSNDQVIDGSDDGFDLVQGCEIWARNFPVAPGIRRDLLMVIAEGHDQFLRYEEEWPYENIQNYPCEVLSFQSSVKTWFNKPALLMAGADTTQALSNEILDSYLSIIRKQKNIWLYDPNFIKEDILTDILNAPDCSVFPVDGLATDGHGQIVVPLPFTNIPADKNQMLGLIQQFMDRSAGTPQPIAAPQSDTATEASIVEQRNTSREDRRGKLMSEFQVRVARKFWQLITQFRPEQAFLIDPEIGQWIEIDEAMARGEYMFQMDITSQSTALALERKQHLDLLNLMAGLTPVFQQLYGQPPNLAEIAKRLLVRGYDEKLPELILPMLTASSAPTSMIAPPTNGVPAQPAPPGGILPQGNNNAPTFTAPPAQAAQQAVQQGKTVGNGIGPVQRDNFNRDLPNAARQSGEAQTV